MNPILIENIELYLEGTMTRQELEETLTEEEVAQIEENIEWVKNSRLAVEAVGLRNQLKEVLPKVAKEEPKEAKIIPFYQNTRQLYWVAASLVILVVAFFGIYSNNQSGLYEKHLYQDPGLPVLMSQSNQYQLYDAMSFYSEGNYEVAAQKLLALQNESGATDTTSYYLGASLLYSGKSTEAIPYFKEIQNSTSSFKERADWLMVLAYLQNNEEENATELLNEIVSNTKHTFYDEAKSLSLDME